MEEEGRVLEVNGNTVKVEVESTACGECDHYRICNAEGCSNGTGDDRIRDCAAYVHPLYAGVSF